MAFTPQRRGYRYRVPVPVPFLLAKKNNNRALQLKILRNNKFPKRHEF